MFLTHVKYSDIHTVFYSNYVSRKHVIFLSNKFDKGEFTCEQEKKPFHKIKVKPWENVTWTDEKQGQYTKKSPRDKQTTSFLLKVQN